MELSFHTKSKISTMIPHLQKSRHQAKNMKSPKGPSFRCNLNLYQVLSLSSEKASISEIKKAYRVKALQYHPDVHPNSTKEETTRRFIELRDAYETLTDPLSRKLYDNELALANSSSFGWSNGRVKMEKNVTSSSYSRDVWERQLAGLKRRSNYRMEKRNGDTRCM